ncbi:MFS transporter [Nesterenkonia xinjiangensis]|uniref:Inositol transporter-like SP family MFS transporter n=1 Tax=Nesterenkonia xinjiangensis TaxID=225327 RepID=A0A7Z0GLV7_9MICC|nr:MFS transporter [Nesterenkonia xinjiangensis]NYJ77889.1 inositol transporter-like SP family MFS transporter [Nesterenkonia xinjiangensis]
MPLTTMTPERRRAWWTAGVAGMASYLDAGAIVTTGTALVLYQDELGITSGQFGQLSALLMVMIGIGALIGGNLSDRFGRRRVFTLTIMMYAVGALVLVAAPGVEALYVGILLLGFASGADLPPSLAMIAESAPENDEGKMVAFSHVLWMIAIPVVSVFGIIVGDMGATGARIMYGHLLVVALIVLALRMRLPESPLWMRRQVAVQTGTVDRSSLKDLFSRRWLPALTGVALFYAITNIAANTNGQFSTYMYVNVAGADVSTASAMSLVGLACSIAASLFLMRIVDTRYRMLGFALGTVTAVIACLVPAVVGVSILALVLFGVVYGIAGIVSGEPMFKVWSQELIPTAHRSTAQGISIAFARVVAAGVGLFTPLILDQSAELMFLFLAAVILVAGLIGFFWVARRPKVLQSEKDADTPAADASSHDLRPATSNAPTIHS